jgi:hypothetical protein
MRPLAVGCGINSLLRAQLKRVTRTFTVEYRQSRRPNAGSTRADWAQAKPAPAGIDDKVNRMTLSTFKAAASHLPTDAISASAALGRILPSLDQVALATKQVKAKGTQSRRYRRAAQSRAEGEVSGKLDPQIHSAIAFEPSVAAATIPQLERATSMDRSVPKTRPSRSDKRTPRPAENLKKFDPASRSSADMTKASPVISTADILLIDKPPSPSRTSRILDRYVFRDERGLGDRWKRKIEARRERRS